MGRPSQDRALNGWTGLDLTRSSDSDQLVYNVELVRAVSRRDLAPLRAGDVVRTARVWPDGLHRTEVHEVFRKGGEVWAPGPEWSFRATKLVVLRKAVPAYA